MPLYVVDTISMFRMRYVVEAKCEEHALDEVTMRDSGAEKDAFDEFSQIHMGEHIADSREITLEEFHRMNKALENKVGVLGSREWGSPWMGEKAIRRINYDE